MDDWATGSGGVRVKVARHSGFQAVPLFRWRLPGSFGDHFLHERAQQFQQVLSQLGELITPAGALGAAAIVIDLRYSKRAESWLGSASLAAGAGFF